MCEHAWAEIKAVRSACDVAVDSYVFLFQYVNRNASQASDQNLDQIARNILNSVQQAANEFTSSLQTATQSQPAH